MPGRTREFPYKTRSMSIIYDALKKVETKIDKPGNNPLQFKMHKEAKPKPKFYAYLIYVLVLCGGFFAAFLLFKFIFPEGQLTAKTATQPAAVAPLKISPKIAPENVAPESPQEIPPSSKDNLLLPPETQERITPLFIVSGVFFSENQGYAIINDRVVKQGAVIEGAMVERINADGVQLKYEGVAIELSPGSN